MAKNPGPVAKFPANGKKGGMLTKKFDTVSNPSSIKLTFDAGYGWGAKTHSQGLRIMLLDADGNGYVFDQHRAKATWAAQWDTVAQYGYGARLQWAPTPIDTTQGAVVDGAGMRTLTISRDGDGNFTFNGEGWDAPLKFKDTTTTSFSQVVLFGTPNTDDELYNKVKLEVTK